MIISRAPIRLTLGGGGTDLESYYSKYGGFLIAATIDKYIYIALNKRFYDDIRLSYHETEFVDDVSQIKHRLFRETLKFCGIKGGVEIVSISDVPPNSGLGTSGSFTVALLKALHAYQGIPISTYNLAEEAYHIEKDILGEPIGKQDQFSTSFGGIICFTFEKNGGVLVVPLKVSKETIERLENNISLFYTGIEREASDILLEQDDKSKENDKDMIENLHLIKGIGLETKLALEKGDVDAFGEFLHTHWQIKKARSNKMTMPFIDACYEEARKNGAIGGKLMGAGGGGFLMFYCRERDKLELREAMAEMGLRPMEFKFEFEGAKILLNTK